MSPKGIVVLLLLYQNKGQKAERVQQYLLAHVLDHGVDDEGKVSMPQHAHHSLQVDAAHEPSTHRIRLKTTKTTTISLPIGQDEKRRDEGQSHEK